MSAIARMQQWRAFFPSRVSCGIYSKCITDTETFYFLFQPIKR
uniref:Uncharacterized protein n=1 Tax=Anguilla anguilla TaxID=7936 RepID=A0A0E9T960_ANGAN